MNLAKRYANQSVCRAKKLLITSTFNLTLDQVITHNVESIDRIRHCLIAMNEDEGILYCRLTDNLSFDYPYSILRERIPINVYSIIHIIRVLAPLPSNGWTDVQVQFRNNMMRVMYTGTSNVTPFVWYVGREYS